MIIAFEVKQAIELAKKNILEKKWQTSVLLKESPIGFISYDQSGTIHLLAVKKDERRKGFANRLLHHTIAQMKARGIKEVRFAIKKRHAIIYKVKEDQILPDELKGLAYHQCVLNIEAKKCSGVNYLPVSNH